MFVLLHKNWQSSRNGAKSLWKNRDGDWWLVDGKFSFSLCKWKCLILNGRIIMVFINEIICSFRSDCAVKMFISIFHVLSFINVAMEHGLHKFSVSWTCEMGFWWQLSLVMSRAYVLTLSQLFRTCAHSESNKSRRSHNLCVFRMAIGLIGFRHSTQKSLIKSARTHLSNWEDFGENWARLFRIKALMSKQ